jgi:hypothetical protein
VGYLEIISKHTKNVVHSAPFSPSEHPTGLVTSSSSSSLSSISSALSSSSSSSSSVGSRATLRKIPMLCIGSSHKLVWAAVGSDIYILSTKVLFFFFNHYLLNMFGVFVYIYKCVHCYNLYDLFIIICLL